MICKNQNKGVAIFSNAFFYILSLNYLEAVSRFRLYLCSCLTKDIGSIGASASNSIVKIALPVRAKLSGRCSTFNIF
jgi:hypothetical protein